MDYGFVAYIDESGDPGIRKVSKFGSEGSSEWLIIGCILIRAEREPQVLRWAHDARTLLDLRQRQDIHYSDLSPKRKAAICGHLATLPLRAFVLMSNKKNMEGHSNPRAEKMRSQQWFYNWCVGLLLERVTDYCEQRSLRDYGAVTKLKIEFSERRDVSYAQTKAYQELLRIQSRAGTLCKGKRDIKADVLHPDLIDAFSHRDRDGLQLADSVPAAFFQAVNAFGPGDWDTQFAKMLRTRMATEHGTHVDYGVAVLQPTPPYRAKLTAKQKQIFQFYGYRL
jgi:hypothetical protein